MKIQLKELRRLVSEVIEEDKKKTKKEKDAEKMQPKGYQKDEKLDFSQPLGANNLYKRQGASNIGPYTSEGALRLFIKECIRQNMNEKQIDFKTLKNALTKRTSKIGKKK